MTPADDRYQPQFANPVLVRVAMIGSGLPRTSRSRRQQLGLSARTSIAPRRAQTHANGPGRPVSHLPPRSVSGLPWQTWIAWPPELHLQCPAGTLDRVAMGHLAGAQTGHGGGAVDYEPDKGQVDRLDMAAGWACFLASGTPPKPDDLPLYLSRAVAAWQKQNPMLTVRATLPIVANGNTMAMHVWFE